MYKANVKFNGAGILEGAYVNGDLHAIKRDAGKAFHDKAVVSVVVFDEAGKSRLYLKKTEAGVVREEN